ncbi:DUF2637 domain-containing protein [Nocardiopsis sp. CNT312]|uniref:DUF2637 domain-containing protein n=1 Tax=Nocardiopsis sp. CNT312 TaxID=1137268 RepID=UPI00048FFEAE|nr:DUF2637 domain-containing protein [Nocardiopsis sp. CNT312]
MDVFPLPVWWVIAAAAVAVTALAVAAMRRAGSRRRPGEGGAVRGSGGSLPGGYVVATAVIAVVALALILVAFTMSYAALYQAATWLEDTQLRAINGGDLRFLFPLGIDAVIVYFLAMDLLMEWQGRRHPLNRWAAYTLSAITIVLNVSQGEETTASYLGHAGPPVVIILIAEGVAAWVRHLAGLAHGQAADRIPVGRWVAHPVSTARVARLMLGWGIGSYPQALEREQRRQLAYAMLREQYGRAWRRRTPRHLRWMLDNGYELDTAYELTRAMTVSAVAMTADEVAVLSGRRPAVAAERRSEPAAPGGEGPEPSRAPVRREPPRRVQEPAGEVERPRERVRERGAAAEEAAAEQAGLSPEEKRQRVRDLVRERPGITDAELAASIGASRRTARRYRDELSAQEGAGGGADPASVSAVTSSWPKVEQPVSQR